MDTALFRAFVAVAETGGFSAAAHLLNRTQSAVSLQIRRLEDRLDTDLFARTSRSVVLTENGKRMLPYARQMLQLEKQALAAVSKKAEQETIRFGLTQEHASAYLADILAAMAQAFPDVRIEIICDISSELVAQFQSGKLELVLAVRHEPSKTGRVLGVEQMIWVAHDRFDAKDDAALPLVLNPEGCIFRAHALAALGRSGRAWREPYVSLSPTGVNIPVRSGLALTVKTQRSLPDGCSDVGARLGLPELGLAEIELHVSPAHIGAAFEFFVNTVDSVCKAPRAVTRSLV